PVLVDGARLPPESELTEELKSLAQRRGAQLRHTHFDADVERLIGIAEAVLPHATLNESLGVIENQAFMTRAKDLARQDEPTPTPPKPKYDEAQLDPPPISPPEPETESAPPPEIGPAPSLPHDAPAGASPPASRPPRPAASPAPMLAPLPPPEQAAGSAPARR